jgi:hypothetical protein
VRVLSRVFRGKFVAGLRQAFHANRLVFFGECQRLTDEKAFAEFLRTLFREEWVVYAKAPFGGPDHVLQYLARYTHRVAISNHRLLSVDDDHVTRAFATSAGWRAAGGAKCFPLCRTLLAAAPTAAVSSANSDTGAWRCPACGGAMRVVERLTAKQILREQSRGVCILDSS